MSSQTKKIVHYQKYVPNSKYPIHSFKPTDSSDKSVLMLDQLVQRVMLESLKLIRMACFIIYVS